MPRTRAKDTNDEASGASSDPEVSDADSVEEEEAHPLDKHAQALDDKDSDEDELERFVLGDDANFREQLLQDDPDDAGSDLDLGGSEADSNHADGSDLEDMADADLFALDVGGAPTGEDLPLAAPAPAPTGAKDEQDGAAPAWEDSDDERLTISLSNTTQLRKLRISEAEDLVNGTEYIRRLRQQYLRLNPMPSWARETQERPTKRRRRSSAASDDSTSSDEDEDDVDASALPLDKFLRDASALQGDETKRRKRLRPEVIDIQRSRDIPDGHREAVTSLVFHPEYPVLLSSSTSSMLHLHHIAPTAHPTPNPLLTSAQVKQVNVQRAEFLYPDGDKIFFAGRRRYIHSWHLPTGNIQKTNKLQGHRLEQKTWERFRLSPCGRYMGVIASTRKGGGVINILNVASMQWIAAARLDSRGGIADFAWWSNGNGLTILGKGGQVGEYSMATRRFLAIWHDEGSNGGTVIALGGADGGQGPELLGRDHWVAVGQSSGIVNIYQRSDLVLPSREDELKLKERPAPARTLEQLTTPVTELVFSPDGQVLAFGSRHKKDALRLAHLPSCTVYRNWPTEQTPLGRISAVAFGRKSDMLVVGNEAGKIRMWEIRH